jgi:pantetheine-phosphate adenylyltransferase
MIEEILKKEDINAEIKIFNGLLVDFMYEENVNILIRGLRALSDYEYELQFTLTNKTLSKSEFETVFLTASREYLYLSSSLVKEVALNKGDLHFFVTENVEQRLIKKVEELKKD